MLKVPVPAVVNNCWKKLRLWGSSLLSFHFINRTAHGVTVDIGDPSLAAIPRSGDRPGAGQRIDDSVSDDSVAPWYDGRRAENSPRAREDGSEQERGGEGAHAGDGARGADRASGVG